jgi:putative transposase
VEVAITQLAPMVGTAGACRAVGWPRSSWYRAHRRSPASPRPPRSPRRPQPRALSAAERQQVLDVLHAERFWDAAPATVYATLLDEGSYLCSPSTMYRLLRGRGETGDRRRHATHPARVKPELLATKPNQCWSWDITKLAGPAKWTWFYLYAILDIYSRYAVGWMVAHREAAVLAERLLAGTLAKHDVAPGQLTVHADSEYVAAGAPGLPDRTAMDARGCWCRDAPKPPDPHADRRAARAVFPRIRRWPGSTRRGARLVDGVT